METLRTYPDLNQHCLQQRLDLPLRLWYLARQHNSKVRGDGWLTLEDVYRVSVGTRRQTRAWLRAGAGMFWHWHGGKYRLAGLGALCEQFDIRLPKAVVDIPRGAVESLADFRAALFASWFASASEEGKTISQAALSELFGRTGRTLRTWARLAGLEVTPNLAIAPVPKSEDDLDRYPAGTMEAMEWGKTWLDDPHQKPNLVWFERFDDHLVVTWKLPNTYCIAWTPGPRTTLQRNASKRAPDPTATGANVSKMYFDKDAKGGAVARAIQGGGPVYLETGTTHPKTGEVVWSRLA